MTRRSLQEIVSRFETYVELFAKFFAAKIVIDGWGLLSLNDRRYNAPNFRSCVVSNPISLSCYVADCGCPSSRWKVWFPEFSGQGALWWVSSNVMDCDWSRARWSELPSSIEGSVGIPQLRLRQHSCQWWQCSGWWFNRSLCRSIVIACRCLVVWFAPMRTR